MFSNKVFYSWQSELPPNKNRNFIEEVLKRAIKNLNKEIEIQTSLDKDTLGELGSPDIINTILNKIKECSFMVADISLTDGDSPNANVIFELGYGVSELGWERVICLFNTKYGRIEDLPFNLRGKRITVYNSDAPNDKNRLIKIIEKTISDLIPSFDGLKVERVLDKQKLDKLLVNVIKYFENIYGSFEKLNSISDVELKKIIEGKSIVGFYLFKNFDIIISELEKLLKSESKFYSKREVKNLIASLLVYLKEFNYYINNRNNPDLFIDTYKTNKKLKVINSKDLNNNNKDGYLLINKLDVDKGQVQDFGEIRNLILVKKATNYFIISYEKLSKYVDLSSKILLLIVNYFNEYMVDLDLFNDFKIQRIDDLNRQLQSYKDIDLTNESIEKLESINLDQLLYFPYEEVILTNIIFHLKKVGYLFNKDEYINEVIGNFYEYQFNINTRVIERIDKSLISEKEYYRLKKEPDLYNVKQVILPNKILSKNRLIFDEELINQSDEFKNIADKLQFNLLQLTPQLIKETIKMSFKPNFYLDRNNIMKKFYSNMKSIEQDVKLFLYSINQESDTIDFEKNKYV
ncbi:hypothetical protein [Facklamia miroungae]|uniref:CD-NTase-associated protein 12/Pycsar effector protein TIR domain-containing protein n=1 Tax=Facklamia miroungae TaxID=120956 RepID=A0A1G7U9R9_9LACT|nr:hypothetical protein [Facklamia miroungae]NKZ30023.1 nucleotide-binding protein [Facklamia miroungae]SDG44332.1 hypothetical protein SAMN05421791_10911 [Facklamia miroungae]